MNDKMLENVLPCEVCDSKDVRIDEIPNNRTKSEALDFSILILCAVVRITDETGYQQSQCSVAIHIHFIYE